VRSRIPPVGRPAPGIAEVALAVVQVPVSMRRGDQMGESSNHAD
jgi:hypothetical protein